jgi:hypothetical protein
MEKLPKYQHLGMTIVINFDESEVKTEEGIRYEYTTAKVCKTSSRDERIEAIIKTKYPTYGSELAAMHKGGEHEVEYNLFREQAKQLADESFNA